jgi:magnesium transporter
MSASTKTTQRKSKRSKKAGLPPGSVVYVGTPPATSVQISYFRFNAETYEEVCNLADVPQQIPVDPESITWVEVEGIHQPEIIEKIGKQFRLHPLVMEDIANATQRPKLEDHDDYLFVVLRMVLFCAKTKQVQIEQLSHIVGAKVVIMFQENHDDVFDALRDRIRQSKGKLRKLGADYLAYTIIDAVVDNYFVVLEQMGEELEAIEQELVKTPTQQTLNRIYSAKRSMMNLRRAGWPLRELASSLERSDSELIQESSRIYLRDLYDHAVEIIDVIENMRDISSGMIDVYLSSMSHKLNEVMKVLTIIATIFMPLTFLSSIYGMNFAHMPELQMAWGYPAILLLMLGVAITMLAYFRRKQWI